MAAAAPTVFTRRRKLFDPKLAEAQLKALQTLFKAWGAGDFSRCFMMILGKKELAPKGVVLLNRRVVPFSWNKIQEDLDNKKANRNIVAKPRQVGDTTFLIGRRLFIPAILEPGTQGLLVSQTKQYGAKHFQILHRFHRTFARNPQLAKVADPKLVQMIQEFHQHVLHTQYAGKYELLYDFLDSRILVDTAENPECGQGITSNHFVATEIARWPGNPEETMANIKESVPEDGTVDLDSTANGMGGYFFEEWQRAQSWPASEFKPHFYPWWWQEEYRLEGRPVAQRTLEEDEKMLMEKFVLDLEQVAWRRWKKLSLRREFDEKYPEDPVTMFLTSGSLFFEKQQLRDMKLRVMTERPLESYRNGQLVIYKRRVKGRRYVIGADVAEGRTVSTNETDFNAAAVLDVDTGEEVAAYRSKIPPEEFAEDLAQLGEMYNFALIAPERNGPGGTVILTLNRHLQYPNVYMHKEWHRERKQVIAVEGFPTNTRTRPIALNKLAAMVRDASELWHDETFIDEALMFVRDPKGKPAGATGAHDDCVMARACAAYVRLVLLGYLDPVETPSEKYGEVGEGEEGEAA